MKQPVGDHGEAVAVLTRCISQHCQQMPLKSNTNSNHTIHYDVRYECNSANATEDLLNANVLPHLTHPTLKVEYLAHLIGVLLNYLYLPTARQSQQYDNLGPHFLSLTFDCIVSITMCAKWKKITWDPGLSRNTEQSRC